MCLVLGYKIIFYVLLSSLSHTRLLKFLHVLHFLVITWYIISVVEVEKQTGSLKI